MWFDPRSLHTTVALASASVIIIYLALAAALLFAIRAIRRDNNGATEKAR